MPVELGFVPTAVAGIAYARANGCRGPWPGGLQAGRPRARGSPGRLRRRGHEPARGEISLSTRAGTGPCRLAAAALVAAASHLTFRAQWRGPLDSLLAYAGYRAPRERKNSSPTGGISTFNCLWPFTLCGVFWSEGLIIAMGLSGPVGQVSAFPCSVDQTQRQFGRFSGLLYARPHSRLLGDPVQDCRGAC